MKNPGRQIFVSLILGAIIYFILSVYGDINSVLSAFKKFNWLIVPLLLLLSLINYYIRFFKWDYYLSLLGIKGDKKLSALVFFSGLIMSVTPMKAGELLKSYLLKQTIEEPVSKTAPVIFAERVTDFLALITIGIIGGMFYNYSIKLLLFISLFLITIILLISNRYLFEAVLSRIEKIRYVKKYSNKLYNLYESSYLMFKIKPLISMIIVSLISWFFECFGFFLILNTMELNISLFMCSFIYAFATVFGAVTFLPGGLGATEGSMTFLLLQHGIAKESAVAATFIVRVVTLWFAVFVGMVGFYLFQKKFGSLIYNGQNQGVIT